jgi:neopullulanase
VRELLWHVATYWLEKGIDGWRLDVPNEINDDSFWQEFRRRCKNVNPEAYIVGELWGEAQRWLQGDQFDAQMNYMFARAAFGFFVGENMDQSDTVRSGYGYIRTLNAVEFAAELDRIFNRLYHPEVVLAQMNMLGSHDTPRTLTVANHDKTAVRLMYLCQMSIPGTPNIYYGDEIGMSGRHDPDCRSAFPWYDEAAWDKELWADIHRYIHLRHNIAALRRGDFRILDATDNVVVFQRYYRGQRAVIAFNTGKEAERIVCPADFPARLSERMTENGQVFAANRKITIEGRSGHVWAD